MRKSIDFVGGALFLTLVLAGCEEAPKRHHKRVHYSQVYADVQGHQYARSYDSGSNDFWFWMYVADGSSSSDTSSRSGSWQRVPSIPSGVTTTSRAVATENGKPTQEEVDAKEVADEEMTNEDSSPSEAQAEAAADAADAGGGDAGGSSGGDSGSDGGGDGGGDG